MPSRERVLEFMEDMESRDVKRLSRWMSESTVFWVPPRDPVVGGRRVLALLRAIFAAYKTFHWEVREIYPVAESRCVYIHETTGTLAKDGAPYTNQVVTLIDFDTEGRVAYLSDYFKCTATFAQPKAKGGAPPICPEPLAR